MSEVGSEQVLVVPAELLRRIGYFQGFTGDVDRYVGVLLDSAHTIYRPRHEVETDPAFKQLIPYVLFCHDDESGGKELFQYTRGLNQDESRLRGRRSVGIGGHIATRDTVVNGHANAFSEGMQREVAEEVSIETPYRQRCVGLINDDDTPVGRVHLGIVYLFDVERPSVFARESEIVESSFMPIDEILPHLDDFEMWSQICLRAMFKVSE
jgi:predicted NUDIX family phosphoesterase